MFGNFSDPIDNLSNIFSVKSFSMVCTEGILRTRLSNECSIMNRDKVHSRCSSLFGNFNKNVALLKKIFGIRINDIILQSSNCFIKYYTFFFNETIQLRVTLTLSYLLYCLSFSTTFGFCEIMRIQIQSYVNENY